MKKMLIVVLSIPCLAQGISAQRPSAVQGTTRLVTNTDTVRRLSIDSDTAFHPIDLQKAVELAQRNAPAAVQARGQIRTANSAERAAYAALLPGINLTAGQSDQGGSRLDPTTGEIKPWTGRHLSYATGVTATMRVFDGGRNWNQISVSKADVNAAEANDVAQQFNVALQVKTQYYAILAARESEAAAATQLVSAEAQLRAAAARVRAGAATLSDSLRSVIQVGNARLALLTAQNNLRVASAALTRLVATPYRVTAQPSDTLERPPAALDSVELLLLAERGPAVRQARAQLASTTAAVRAARGPYLPTFDLTYSTAGSGFDQYYGFGKPFAYANTFRINASYPLFNNYQRENNLTQARVAQANADAVLRDARLAAQQNLVQQLASLRAAQERIEIQQASVASAEEDLRVQQQRYALGASTLLDLLTSQTTLDQQRAALIQARLDYRIARAQIEAIIGRDLQ